MVRARHSVWHKVRGYPTESERAYCYSIVNDLDRLGDPSTNPGRPLGLPFRCD
jgi:hypothetical protein